MGKQALSTSISGTNNLLHSLKAVCEYYHLPYHGSFKDNVTVYFGQFSHKKKIHKKRSILDNSNLLSPQP